MVSAEYQPLLDEKMVHIDMCYEIPKNSTKTRPWRIWKLTITAAILLIAYSVYTAYNTFTQPGESGYKNVPKASRFSCIPGQPCWPSSYDWSTFNSSINGNLRLTVPWAAPCYTNSSSEACKKVGQQYLNSVSRTSNYGVMEFLDWESCGQSHCYLDSFSPSSPTLGECSLGRMSTYHVEAHTADDISKTLYFVREHDIRVSVKNTGHDYYGRSSAANSLGIWTHHMKEIKYHKTFQPKGCSTRYENIGEIGAGIQAHEAWDFFQPLNMLVTVGAVESVGIAGGFGQGGGHGPLGPKYGLMVDQAVEFDVVTADGQFRTINECNDPDLFWAMRGGGGGSFAILTSYKFQLHPAVPINIYSFQAKVKMPEGGKKNLDITKSEAHRDLIRSLAMNQTLFSSHGMAGYNFLHPDHVISLQVLPSTNTTAIESITAQYRSFLSAHPGFEIEEDAYHTFPTYSEWHNFTTAPEMAKNGLVGTGLSISGRFIPRTHFKTESSIDALVEATVAAMQLSYTNRGTGMAQLYATGPALHRDGSKTGVHPLWRESLWHVIMGGIWTSSWSEMERKQVRSTISAAVQPFKALTPGGGCYLNEGDWTEENWEDAFFGTNYPRLLQIKNRYDPEGIFNCWKCVGWNGYADEMYSCYAQSHEEPRPSIPLEPVE